METTTPEMIAIPRQEGTSFTVHWHGAEPADPVVLLVPAMGVQAGYYGKLAAALHAQGFSIAVTELRGHEASGGVRPSRAYDFGYTDLVADLHQAVDAVRSRRPEAPIYLLGHSLGGHLGAVFAAHHPTALAGLMVVASGSVWWRLWNRRMYAVGVAIDLSSRLLGYFPGHRLGFAGREARGQMRDWVRFNRTGRLEFGSPPIDHDPAIAGLRLPVLGISCEGDSFAPPKALNGLLAKFPRASITRLHVGAEQAEPPGHLRWARRPELVVDHIAGWVDAQEGGGGDGETLASREGAVSRTRARSGDTEVHREDSGKAASSTA